MKKIITVSAIAFLIIFASSCNNNSKTIKNDGIEFGETNIDTISYFSAEVSTLLGCIKGNIITKYGHCWSTSLKPTIENNKTNFGYIDKPIIFTSELSGLSGDSTYYVRPYVVYNKKPVYGDQVTFHTIKTGTPVVTTLSVINVSLSRAQCVAEVVADSGLKILSRGICWSTSPDFEISECEDSIVSGTGLGSYVMNILDLSQGTNYYVKAFATTEVDTYFGLPIKFRTGSISLPRIRTNEVTNIRANTAICGGKIISTGKTSITQSGICWSESNNPTIGNCLGFTKNKKIVSTFKNKLTDLEPSRTYYVAAYATNKKGTSYGQVKKFNTKLVELIYVQGGTFNMGSDDGQPDGRPMHKVTVDDFYIGRYEVTNLQFAAFLNSIKCNSSGYFNSVEYIHIVGEKCNIEFTNGKFKPKFDKDYLPVVDVTWFGANAFAEWVGGKLPTEAQWEYAANGGKYNSNTTYSGSDTANFVSWNNSNSKNNPHVVGTLLPNKLGIYDMSGNVWEWCSDWYNPKYYTFKSQINPQGPPTGNTRALKGGSWDYNPDVSRITNRFGYNPNATNYDYGFRIIKDTK